MKSDWTAADIPPQAGKRAVVTGTGGLGYETALELARAGAAVVIAGRSRAKGEAALARIAAASPSAAVSFGMLDLADLASVEAFAAGVRAEHSRLDILVNNAGVMALPARATTTDGFERQLGVNFLGHFALTAHLLPALRASASPRVVSLSSLAHRRGRIDFDDLHGERRYGPWKAYSQSKLAMLIFAIELQRRSEAGGWGLTSIAAHPGWAATELIANGPAGGGGLSAALGHAARLLGPLLSQSPAAGALPTLFAATAPEAEAGGYYGPGGFREIRGSPAPSRMIDEAGDPAVAARLWDEALRLTGARFPVRPQASIGDG